MAKTGGTVARVNYKVFIWAGLGIWLMSALLFWLNTGPFVAQPLRITAIIGFVLLIVGLVKWWRGRERPASD